MLPSVKNRRGDVGLSDFVGWFKLRMVSENGIKQTPEDIIVGKS